MCGSFHGELLVITRGNQRVLMTKSDLPLIFAGKITTLHPRQVEEVNTNWPAGHWHVKSTSLWKMVVPFGMVILTVFPFFFGYTHSFFFFFWRAVLSSGWFQLRGFSMSMKTAYPSSSSWLVFSILDTLVKPLEWQLSPIWLIGGSSQLTKPYFSEGLKSTPPTSWLLTIINHHHNHILTVYHHISQQYIIITINHY